MPSEGFPSRCSVSAVFQAVHTGNCRCTQPALATRRPPASCCIYGEAEASVAAAKRTLISVLHRPEACECTLSIPANQGRRSHRSSPGSKARARISGVIAATAGNRSKWTCSMASTGPSVSGKFCVQSSAVYMRTRALSGHEGTVLACSSKAWLPGGLGRPSAEDSMCYRGGQRDTAGSSCGMRDRGDGTTLKQVKQVTADRVLELRWLRS
jgi:hypothetical protein